MMISNNSFQQDRKQRHILEDLKIRLRSENKRRLTKEKLFLKFHNTERYLLEELHATKIEIDFLTEKLEDVKDKISEATNQIRNIEIQKAIEKNKLEFHTKHLIVRKISFAEMFHKEQDLLELQNKEILKKEAEELELIKQKELEIVEKNQHLANQVAAVEGECDAIERECVVLKKRNNAIMLKLRRRLVETENKRRNVMNAN